jgi:N-acetyl sugar amidotransferase
MHNICPKCLYPQNHPFGISINNKECSGCFTHREKYVIDWTVKREELENRIKKYKKHNKKYDCVVPVVGDAEDFYTLSKVLELGLSPLVVCVNDYFKNDIGWHNLHQLITHFDVDSLVFNPDMRAYKELIRTSLRKFDHILLPFLQLHTSFPVHVAYDRNIPLIIWGQNQAVEQVGKFSHHDAVEMSRWNRRQHDLFEIETDYLVGNGAQVDLRHLNYYKYPKPSALNRRGVKGLYLSNYFKWDPLVQNQSVVDFGFNPEVNNSSFDIFERAGSSVYYNFHDLLKYKRVGYRKVDDHIAREIRHGRLNKKEGIYLSDHYTCSKVHIRPFFDWLDVTSTGYEWFCKHKLGAVRHLISDEPVTSKPVTLPENIRELLSRASTAASHYIVFGKGLQIDT